MTGNSWKIARDSIAVNTKEFESKPFVKSTGFREYDARWLFPSEINLLGVQALGMAIATQLRMLGAKPPRVVVGHDYRSYSASIKHALVVGLLSSGAQVHDVGSSGSTGLCLFLQPFQFLGTLPDVGGERDDITAIVLAEPRDDD